MPPPFRVWVSLAVSFFMLMIELKIKIGNDPLDQFCFIPPAFTVWVSVAVSFFTLTIALGF